MIFFVSGATQPFPVFASSKKQAPMPYLIAGILIICVLLLVNFLLLKYSCNKADSENQTRQNPENKKENPLVQSQVSIHK